MPRVNENKQLTPFAEALQDWMFHNHRIPWSRPRLAAELGLPHSTVNGWFADVKRNPTLPGPDALTALERVTQWSRDRLMELTGYSEWPVAAERESEFIRAYIERAPNLTHLEREKFSRLITDAMAEYLATPKRPPRKSRARKAGPAPSSASAKDAAPTPIESGSRDEVSAAK